MNGLINGIDIQTERNWTWIYGNTYPIKEELKQQGFLWSAKRRAWYNQSIVEVKLNNNGNGHKEVKPTQHSTEHAQQPKTPIEMVKTKVKEKTLEEEVLEYMKTKLNGAEPLVSGEWLSKQEKLGRTFFQLKPQIDNLIEDSLQTEKRVKEAELSEHDKALLEGNYKIEGKPVLKEKEAWRTEEYEKTVNELKERFGMLNPM